jgi:hypothetical protein
MIATLLTVAIPTLMVLVGILLNRNDANRLDSRITALETSLRGEMTSIRSEMVTLRSQFHNDVLMLLGSDKEQDRRITRLEERA